MNADNLTISELWARHYADPEDITLSFDGIKEPLAIERNGTTAVCLLSRIDA
jgi:hypothetical protein